MPALLSGLLVPFHLPVVVKLKELLYHCSDCAKRANRFFRPTRPEHYNIHTEDKHLEK